MRRFASGAISTAPPPRTFPDVSRCRESRPQRTRPSRLKTRGLMPGRVRTFSGHSRAAGRLSRFATVIRRPPMFRLSRRVVAKQMKRLLPILFLTLLTQAVPLPQELATASIEGTVVRIGTGEILSKASVELVSVGAPGSFSTTTESDGRFYFPNVPAGTY